MRSTTSPISPRALCDAPVALVTLVEEDEQRFLARVGTDLEGTPRDLSFCAHAIGGSDLMEVPRRDAATRASPTIRWSPARRMSASMPARRWSRDEGVPLGSLCVIDTEPRRTG